jgi:hypothetical protein
MIKFLQKLEVVWTKNAKFWSKFFKIGPWFQNPFALSDAPSNERLYSSDPKKFLKEW